MIVLPNSFEKYLSALRISVSISILKHGLQPRHIDNLRKIHIAESLFHQNERQGVDINKLCTNLLEAVSTIKQGFKFEVKVVGNLYLNKNIFTLLLLNFAKQKDFVKISAKDNFLKINFEGKAKSLSHLINASGGFSLYEVKTKQTIIIIPANQTNEKSVEIETEWEYLFNKFSVVNMVFGML